MFGAWPPANSHFQAGVKAPSSESSRAWTHRATYTGAHLNLLRPNLRSSTLSCSMFAREFGSCSVFGAATIVTHSEFIHSFATQAAWTLKRERERVFRRQRPRATPSQVKERASASAAHFCCYAWQWSMAFAAVDWQSQWPGIISISLLLDLLQLSLSLGDASLALRRPSQWPAQQQQLQVITQLNSIPPQLMNELLAMSCARCVYAFPESSSEKTSPFDRNAL